MVKPTSWGDRDKKRTADMGDEHPVLKVNDMSQASNQLSITSEAVTFSAGVAGTTGVVALDSAPLMDSTGALIGSVSSSSFTWTTGTVLTTEVDWNYDASDATQLADLANGEFAIDYNTGKIRYAKATAGVSDNANYTTRQTNIQVTTTGSTSVTEATHDSAVATAGPQVMFEAKDFDGANFPNDVQEGDAVRPAGSLYGVQYVSIVDESGSDTPLALHDLPIGSGLGEKGFMTVYEAAAYDGAVLPNAVAEGDAVRPKATKYGVQYVTVVNEDGSSRPAYDSSTDSNKVFEVNPISDHHTEETIYSVAAPSAVNGPTAYYIDMDGFRSFAFQSYFTGTGTGTITVEASIQDDGTSASSGLRRYVDVTNSWFGAASFTGNNILERDTPVAVKYIKVKLVIAGKAADTAYEGYVKKSY